MSHSQKNRIRPENIKIELGEVEEKPARATQLDIQIDRSTKFWPPAEHQLSQYAKLERLNEPNSIKRAKWAKMGQNSGRKKIQSALTSLVAKNLCKLL